MAKLVEKKIKKITKLGEQEVIDLTVADAHHYISNNGVINHNSGIVYGASIILNLSKAKLKEGTEVIGQRVIARPEKNRFCKPIPVEFHIQFDRGMNPYVGLQDYVTWERCGIDRGKFIDAKEYEKMKDKSGAYPSADPDKFFVPSASGRNICCDDGTCVPLKQFFTPQVFTPERLERLDKYLQTVFAYAKGEADALGMLDEEIGDADSEDDDDMTDGAPAGAVATSADAELTELFNQ